MEAGPLIGALIGGFLASGGAWLNAKIQHNRQIQRDRKTLVLGKLEETYETLIRLKKAQSDLFLGVLSQGKIKGEDDVRGLLGRLSVLIGCYAPELSGHVAEIERLFLEEYEVSLLPIIQAAGNTQKIAGYAKPVAEKQLAVKDACSRLQERVLELARNQV